MWHSQKLFLKIIESIIWRCFTITVFTANVDVVDVVQRSARRFQVAGWGGFAPGTLVSCVRGPGSLLKGPTILLFLFKVEWSLRTWKITAVVLVRFSGPSQWSPFVCVLCVRAYTLVTNTQFQVTKMSSESGKQNCSCLLLVRWLVSFHPWPDLVPSAPPLHLRRHVLFWVLPPCLAHVVCTKEPRAHFKTGSWRVGLSGDLSWRKKTFSNLPPCATWWEMAWFPAQDKAVTPQMKHCTHCVLLVFSGDKLDCSAAIWLLAAALIAKMQIYLFIFLIKRGLFLLSV